MAEADRSLSSHLDVQQIGDVLISHIYYEKNRTLARGHAARSALRAPRYLSDMMNGLIDGLKESVTDVLIPCES